MVQPPLPPPASVGSRLYTFGGNFLQTFYHATAMLLGGEEYEWVTWPGRVLRIAFLFVVLILVSTYTANLAAFFSRPTVVIEGPQTYAELRDAIVCVPVENRFLDDFVKKQIWMPLPEGQTMFGFMGEMGDGEIGETGASDDQGGEGGEAVDINMREKESSEDESNFDLILSEREQWCHDAVKHGQADAWFGTRYGARSQAECCTRGCHLIPRCSLERTCVGVHCSYRCLHKSCRNTEGTACNHICLTAALPSTCQP
jgi:hypothetical protein